MEHYIAFYIFTIKFLGRINKILNTSYRAKSLVSISVSPLTRYLLFACTQKSTINYTYKIKEKLFV